MTQATNLGYPRIGRRRELKTALEAFWSGKTNQSDLEETAKALRTQNWQFQQSSGIDLIPSNDFSLYDHVLDTAAMVGAVPERFLWNGDKVDLQTYFLMARGALKLKNTNGRSVEAQAMDMTKWFNTNYHYIVPEISDDQKFVPSFDKCIDDFNEAKGLGLVTRPVLVGPVSFLRLSKGFATSKLSRLVPALVDVYLHYISILKSAGAQWIQMDEPCLSLDLEPEWHDAYKLAYKKLADGGASLLLATYFSSLGDNATLALNLPVQGLHVDLVNGAAEVDALLAGWQKDMYFSAGVVDGHNVWATNLSRAVDMLEHVADKVGPDKLMVAPSCSLIHVPIDVERETEIDDELKSWLAFADQKVKEIAILTDALCLGHNEVATALSTNRTVIANQRTSGRRNNPAIVERMRSLTDDMYNRGNPFEHRYVVQQKKLKLPLLPTTTIGSFPQTKEIREARKHFRIGSMSGVTYEWTMQSEIANNIQLQEKIGLDVFVHGEPERNDMVEYFSEMLEGMTSTLHGWVQSYGSRYVKPPIIFGAVSRPQPMTVRWAKHAQSLTNKPVKGMLTGPVTILQWSFVRDDQPRETTCRELALAIRDEVSDLEAAGIGVIQIDEPAIREGLPLKLSEWADYLAWSVDCFKLSTSSVADETQIHTHMCYSEFGDMVDAIIRMDADVISIEAARSQMDLISALRKSRYPNAIGPGVYDIHSPRIPGEDEMATLLTKALDIISIERLWVNPDCGLKTRHWEEVVPALNAMVQTAIKLRKERTAGLIAKA